MRLPLLAASTALVLAAFAGNSLLVRLALADRLLSPEAFTLIRLVSGAAVLAMLITAGRGSRNLWRAGRWSGGAALFGYAALFSWAYLDLDAGTGALVLFAAVQLSMIGWGLARGERLHGLAALGPPLAGAGLLWLLLPGSARPDPLAALAMTGAGLCWGVYSLLGRGRNDATLATAGNFLRASLIAVPVVSALVWASQGTAIPATASGILVACLCGGLTSGLGYALWYRVLPHLTATRAGVVQLAVPPLAALGGLAFLSEPPTLRLFAASALILVGIGLSLRRHPQSRPRNSAPPRLFR